MRPRPLQPCPSPALATGLPRRRSSSYINIDQSFRLSNPASHICPQDAMTMFRLLRPRPCSQWMTAFSRHRCRTAPDSIFMLSKAFPWSPRCQHNSPLWTASATKGLDQPLAMYVYPSPRCFDESDVHIRKTRERFALSKGIPYSTSKRPEGIKRYERKFHPVPSE
jgi:hypothetical protein